MKVDYQKLWRSLLGHLERKGELPLRYHSMTPAEIGREMLSTRQDDRAHRFVWGYYYPAFYGQEAGTLSDAEAVALVASFAPRSFRSSTVEAPGPGERAKCLICVARPERGDPRPMNS